MNQDRLSYLSGTATNFATFESASGNSRRANGMR